MWLSCRVLFTPIGADTQILGNFEYRIPVIGNTVGLAAFADIGSAFNLRGKKDQFFNSNFLDDSPFLTSVGFFRCTGRNNQLALTNLSALAACNAGTDLALVGDQFGNPALVLRDTRLATSTELDTAFRNSNVNPYYQFTLWFSTGVSARSGANQHGCSYLTAFSPSLEIIGLAWGWKCGCRCRSSTCLFA